MEMLIVYDGKRGRIRKAAEAMALVAEATGADATVRPMDMVKPKEAALADALVTGCWIKGDVPFGGAQAARMADWIERLPALDGKPVGAFCSYGFFPVSFADAVARTSEVLAQMKARFEDKGADVVTTLAIHRRSPDSDVAALVGSVLEHVDV